ncbi:MAG: hypothetical protein EPO24_00715 [Bacteroidetes bacterium]|nr:MAG: hypothetical protein EPO24_00715 [Bacteroidota bacterium]
MPRLLNFETPEGIRFTHVKNLDYKKFKLFLLSILWKASISKRTFFKDVKLGPHERVIAKTILTGNPGALEDYPILFFTYLNDRSAPSNLIAEPGIIKNSQGTKYIVIIAGFTFVFHISRHDLSPNVLESTITPEGELKIFHIPLGMSWRLIMSYFGIKPIK